MIKNLFLFGTFTGMMLGAVAARAETCPSTHAPREVIVSQMFAKWSEQPIVSIKLEDGIQELYLSTGEGDRAWTVIMYIEGTDCGRILTAGEGWGNFESLAGSIEGEPL